MKYVVKCKACGEYEVNMDLPPSCCIKCSNLHAEIITIISPKVKARVERAMRIMDDLKPQIKAAHDEYMRLMVLYEDECQLLRGYARRGVIPRDSAEPYLMRNNKDNHKKSLNTLLKEYRLSKKEQE